MHTNDEPANNTMNPKHCNDSTHCIDNTPFLMFAHKGTLLPASIIRKTVDAGLCTKSQMKNFSKAFLFVAGKHGLSVWMKHTKATKKNRMSIYVKHSGGKTRKALFLDGKYAALKSITADITAYLQTNYPANLNLGDLAEIKAFMYCIKKHLVVGNESEYFKRGRSTDNDTEGVWAYPHKGELYPSFSEGRFIPINFSTMSPLEAANLLGISRANNKTKADLVILVKSVGFLGASVKAGKLSPTIFNASHATMMQKVYTFDLSNTKEANIMRMAEKKYNNDAIGYMKTKNTQEKKKGKKITPNFSGNVTISKKIDTFIASKKMVAKYQVANNHLDEFLGGNDSHGKTLRDSHKFAQNVVDSVFTRGASFIVKDNANIALIMDCMSKSNAKGEVNDNGVASLVLMVSVDGEIFGNEIYTIKDCVGKFWPLFYFESVSFSKYGAIVEFIYDEVNGIGTIIINVPMAIRMKPYASDEVSSLSAGIFASNSKIEFVSARNVESDIFDVARRELMSYISDTPSDTPSSILSKGKIHSTGLAPLVFERKMEILTSV